MAPRLPSNTPKGFPGPPLAASPDDPAGCKAVRNQGKDQLKDQLRVETYRSSAL